MMSLIPLPYRLLAYALIGAALVAFGWVKGNQHGTEKLIAYQGAQAIAEVKLAQAQAKVVTVIQTKYQDRIQTIQLAGETITKEVYVTKTDDAGCTVPVGFVREFGAAWSGTPPGPPAESDRGPSGVPLSEIASDDAGNATSCLVYKAQRDGLIEFYRKLQATSQ